MTRFNRILIGGALSASTLGLLTGPAYADPAATPPILRKPVPGRPMHFHLPPQVARTPQTELCEQQGQAAMDRCAGAPQAQPATCGDVAIAAYEDCMTLRRHPPRGPNAQRNEAKQVKRQ